MKYRLSAYRWVIISLLSFSYLVVYVHRLCPAVLAQDLMKSFNASGAVTGLMASAYFYAYALMQIPSGMIVDKLGSRLLITVCMCVAGVGAVLFSLAESVTTAFWSRVLVGFGVSAVLVPSYKALTAWFSTRQYVMAASTVISVAGFGSAVAGSPLAWLSDQIGWRGSTQVIAALTFITGLLVWVLVRNTPQELGLPPVEQELMATESSGEPIAWRKAFALILGNKDFWLLATWFFFNAAILFSFAGLWAGPYFMQVYGMSKTSAGSLINVFSVGWVLGPLFFGWIAVRLPFHGRLLGASMSGMALISLWMLIRNGSMSLPELYAHNILFGVLGAGPAGVCFTAAKERFPTQIAGTVSGTLYLFPMVGSAVFQPLAGAILDRSGNLAGGLGSQDFSALFLLYVVICSLAGAAGFMLPQRPGRLDIHPAGPMS